MINLFSSSFDNLLLDFIFNSLNKVCSNSKGISFLFSNFNLFEIIFKYNSSEFFPFKISGLGSTVLFLQIESNKSFLLFNFFSIINKSL